MLAFPCPVCNAPQSTDPANAGLMIRCAQCATAIRVPPLSHAASAANDDDVLIPFANDDEQPAAVPSRQRPEVTGEFIEPRQPAAAAAASTAGSSIAATKSSATMAIPAPPQAPPQQPQRRVSIPAGMRPPVTGKRYGFNCVYCSSRLEATDNMAAQEGQCPTCGSTIVIPILDRYGRLIDPITKQVIKQDPHPVHAYAAAGERAPKIVRQTSGQQIIICPRCGSASAITSNNCKNCGMPFTMEGTTLEAAGANNAMCLTSLVLGIIGIPIFCSHILPILAIIFGIIGLNQVNSSGGSTSGRGMAIAGIVCGGIGLVLLAMWYAR